MFSSNGSSSDSSVPLSSCPHVACFFLAKQHFLIAGHFDTDTANSSWRFYRLFLRFSPIIDSHIWHGSGCGYCRVRGSKPGSWMSMPWSVALPWEGIVKSARLFTLMWLSCRWNHSCPWRMPPLQHSWHVACHCSVVCRSICLLVVCCYFLLRYFRRFPRPPSKNSEAIVRGGRHWCVVSESSDVGGDILYIKAQIWIWDLGLEWPKISGSRNGE